MRTQANTDACGATSSARPGIGMSGVLARNEVSQSMRTLYKLLPAHLVRLEYVALSLRVHQRMEDRKGSGKSNQYVL